MHETLTCPVRWPSVRRNLTELNPSLEETVIGMLQERSKNGMVIGRHIVINCMYSMYIYIYIWYLQLWFKWFMVRGLCFVLVCDGV
jgi:hypothetical protein